MKKSKQISTIKSNHNSIKKPNQIVPIKVEGANLAPTGHLTYHGGHLLTNVEVYTIFWGSAWQIAPQHNLIQQINSFFDSILTSSMMDLLNEYSVPGMTIGHGKRVGSTIITNSEPGTIVGNSRQITDIQLQQSLQNFISHGIIPQPNSNTLYFVYLPPNVISVLGNSSSCVNFCGYHGHIGNSIFYAVEPFVTCNGCSFGNILDTLTIVSSHELCEAITDPGLDAWFDPTNGNEIGDICNRIFQRIGSYAVQLEWSNKSSVCLLSPPFSSWLELDNNPATVNIIADSNRLYQLHNTGRIWIYTGVPHTGWQELDNNPATVKIITSGGNLYQLHNSGRIWIYTGTPHTGWLELDNNPATIDIVADGNRLYQLHNSGRIWIYTGVPHTGWQELDNNPATVKIIASGGNLYQLHNSGRIWIYTGTPHTGWLELDNNPATIDIVADGNRLYQLHNSGRIWIYTGVPHSGWQELDNNPATVKIIASGGNLYQLHNSGRIWKYTGIPHTGWSELDNNPATKNIVADGNRLYQLHNTGRIWVYTGV